MLCRVLSVVNIRTLLLCAAHAAELKVRCNKVYTRSRHVMENNQTFRLPNVVDDTEVANADGVAIVNTVLISAHYCSSYSNVGTVWSIDT